MKRAQSALEFVLITVVMLLFFAAAFIASQSTYATIQQERLDQSVYDYFDRIESEVGMAWDLGEGYERDIIFPKTFSGVPFDIELRLNQSVNSTDEIVINVSNQQFFYFLQFPVNGTLGHGNYTIVGGDPVQLLRN